MDLNRLPSGKFATNHLVCALAAVAMNLLCSVGQQTLHESDSPKRKAALRPRLATNWANEFTRYAKRRALRGAGVRLRRSLGEKPLAQRL